MSKMLVHSGASFHGHEYSPPIDRNNSVHHRSSRLAQAVYSPTTKQSSYISEKPVPIIRRPGRSLSDVSLRTYEHTVRFQELDSYTMDGDDGRSIANSDSSEPVSAKRRRRKSSKSASAFTFAYSAPTQLRKQRLLQIRPRKLMQLQHLPPGSRPIPVIDVLASTVVVPRLMKRFPRMFRGKGELGANDVMIVKSEAYDTAAANVDTDSDEESISSRELLAVICQAHRDSAAGSAMAELVLSDGSLWTASPFAKDSFEFIRMDAAGNHTTARWAKKAIKGKSADGPDATEGLHDPQYSFSIIDPSTRRHPIIATLNSNNLKIYDSYSPIVSLAESSAPTSPVRINIMEPEPLTMRIPENSEIVYVDDRLKMLIQVTAIWVGLRKGWCPYFRYNDVVATPNPSVRSRVASGVVNRCPSVSVAPNGSTGPSKRTETPEPTHSPIAIAHDKKRRNDGLTSTQLAATLDSPPQRPQRTVSTGSAFMQRTAAKRGYSYPSVADGSQDDQLPLSLGRAILEMHDDKQTTSARQPTDGLRNAALIPTSKSQSRPHSTILPANGHNAVRPHVDKPREKSPVRDSSPKANKKYKMSRWKSITNLFRRGPKSS